MRRKVEIEEKGDTFRVVFVDRKYRQRHYAAVFHKSMRYRAGVEDWVRSQTWLELVPPSH